MSRGKQRIYPRYTTELPVEIIAHSGAVSAVSVDLSIGGMRVQSPSPLEFGAAVKVRFRLPTLDEDTEVEATVRWVQGDRAGLQFGSLRARDVWAMNKLFKEQG